MFRMISCASAILFATVLSGCAGFGVHRIDIQQGNLITQEQLAKVKAGMSRQDVKNALGTPLMQDVFHADRWDYYFTNEMSTKFGPFGREHQKFHVTILFEKELVAKIEGTASPTEVLLGGGERRFTPKSDIPGMPDPKKQPQ
jgi:outer membrane protein assembly factor BamE